MNSKNPDGLRYPSIDDLLQVIDSKYKLAYTAAKRAKIIKADNYSSMEELGGNKCDKPVGEALEEIMAGKIQIEFAANTSDQDKPEKVSLSQTISVGVADDDESTSETDSEADQIELEEEEEDAKPVDTSSNSEDN